MKKKLANHGKKIASGMVFGHTKQEDFQVEKDGIYYVCDGVQILQSEEMFPDVPINENSIIINMCAKWMNTEGKNLTCQMLPDLEIIKKGIRVICGRKLDRIVYKAGNDFPLFNARYLRDAMNALNAACAYYDKTEGKRGACYLFENDDVTSNTYTLILPICNNDCIEEGFHDIDTKEYVSMKGVLENEA